MLYDMKEKVNYRKIMNLSARYKIEGWTFLYKSRDNSSERRKTKVPSSKKEKVISLDKAIGLISLFIES